MFENIDGIKKENWREAKGIKASRSETNSALATRDYSVKCEPRQLIMVLEGYWLWWCSAHHQPLAWCDKAKAIQEIKQKIGKILSEK